MKIFESFEITLTFAQANATIQFTYDATGSKLKKEVNGSDPDGNPVNYIRYYIGGIEYKDDGVEAVYHSEGRVAFDLETEARYEYNLNDHLGNVRVVFSDLNKDGVIEVGSATSEILQENHYYPFGMGSCVHDLAA